MDLMPLIFDVETHALAQNMRIEFVYLFILRVTYLTYH